MPLKKKQKRPPVVLPDLVSVGSRYHRRINRNKKGNNRTCSSSVLVSLIQCIKIRRFSFFSLIKLCRVGTCVQNDTYFCPRMSDKL